MGPPDNPLTRVEFTYADGSRRALSGVSARAWEWENDLRARAFSALLRGAPAQKFDWEEVRDDPEPAALRSRMRAAFFLLSSAHKAVHRDCDVCDALRLLTDEGLSADTVECGRVK